MTARFDDGPGGGEGGTPAAARPSTSWRSVEACREGLEAVIHGRWTTILLLIGLTGLMAVPAVADALTVARISRQERAWTEAGGRVLVAVPAPGEQGADGIDGFACAALDRLDGIEAAVPVTRYSAPTQFVAQPARDLSLYQTTSAVLRLPGVRGTVAANSSPGSEQRLLVAPEAANPAGLVDGSSTRLVAELPRPGGAGNVIADAPGAWIPAVTGGVRQVDVVDLAVLGDEASLGVVVVGAATPLADRCLVAVEPGMVEAVRAVVGGLVGRDGRPAAVADRLGEGEFGPDFARDLHERPLRWGFLATGVAAALLWGLVRWTRRGEDALYATVGADRTTTGLIRGTEWAVASVIALTWSWCVATSLAVVLGAPVGASGSVAARYALGTVAVATPFVLLGLFRRPSVLSALKDR